MAPCGCVSFRLGAEEETLTRPNEAMKKFKIKTFHQTCLRIPPPHPSQKITQFTKRKAIRTDCETSWGEKDGKTTNRLTSSGRYQYLSIQKIVPFSNRVSRSVRGSSSSLKITLEREAPVCSNKKLFSRCPCKLVVHVRLHCVTF